MGETTGEFDINEIKLDEGEDLVNHEEALKSQIQDEINDMDEEEIEEAAKELHPALETLKKLVDLVNKKLPKKKAKKIKDVAQADDPTTAEQKPKRKFKVIHLIIFLGIAFFLFEEEIMSLTEEPAPVVKLKKRPRPKKKAVQVKETQKKEEATEPTAQPSKEDPLMIGNKEEPKLDTVSDSKPELEDTTTPETTTSETDKSEDITDLFKDQMDDDTTNDAPVAQESDYQEPVIAKPVDEEPEVEEPEVEEPDVVEPEESVAGSADEDKRVQDSKEFTSAPIEDDKAQDFLVDSFEDNTEDITESIMSDLEKKIKDKKDEATTMLDSNLNQAYEFTDVPDYEYVGRALVYNCTDKHWACIDIKSYSLCQKNYDYNKANSKIIQCYPKAIFEADLDCEKQQLTNVSNSSPTKFCN